MTAITSKSEFSRPSKHLRKFLPMRPNPLMATLTLDVVVSLFDAAPLTLLAAFLFTRADFLDEKAVVEAENMAFGVVACKGVWV